MIVDTSCYRVDMMGLETSAGDLGHTQRVSREGGR